MSVSLSKGQKVSLAKRDGGSLSRVRMGLGWDAVKKKGLLAGLKSQSIDLDASALLFDAAGQLVDQVWFQQLRSKDGAVQHKISARSLWIRILTARIETGEPYLIFVDHVNKARPEHHKLAGLEIKTSNLCSEITLPTGVDRHGKQRTAV